jgi:uncharacterized protein
MTDQSRPTEPPGTPSAHWHAPSPDGYPPAPPVAAEPVPYGPPVLNEPPPQGPPRYGAGPVPVMPVASSTATLPYEEAWFGQPVAAPAPHPGTVFWPTTTAWMGLDPERPARWGIPDIVLAIIAFLVGTLLFSGAVLGIGAAATGLSAEAFVRQYASYVNIAGLLGSWVAVVSFLKLISALKGANSLRRDFGFAFSWWDPLIGLGAAFVTLMLSGVVQVIVSTLTGSPPASNSDQVFGDFVEHTPMLVVMGVLAAVGAPLVEELLFRGLALRSIEKRLGGVAAVIGSSVLFGAMHVLPGWGVVSPLALFAGITVYGAIFAVLTRWWCRLGPAVFTHIWVNTLATAFVLVPVLLK